ASGLRILRAPSSRRPSRCASRSDRSARREAREPRAGAECVDIRTPGSHPTEIRGQRFCRGPGTQDIGGHNKAPISDRGLCCGWGRGRTGDLPLFRRTLVRTELPSRGVSRETPAVLTGLQPAASTLTGRRALQTAPQDQACRTTVSHKVMRAPNGIRTRATALKGRRPRPLDDEGYRPAWALLSASGT